MCVCVCVYVFVYLLVLYIFIYIFELIFLFTLITSFVIETDYQINQPMYNCLIDHENIPVSGEWKGMEQYENERTQKRERAKGKALDVNKWWE